MIFTHLFYKLKLKNTNKNIREKKMNLELKNQNFLPLEIHITLLGARHSLFKR